MRFILAIQTGIILSGILIAIVLGTEPAKYLSFAVGGGILLANFILLGICWSLVLKKKLVALALAIIVSKYALLALLINKMVKSQYFDFIWMFAGLATLVVTALILLLLKSRRRSICLLPGPH